jgi:hypothetical protein
MYLNKVFRTSVENQEAYFRVVLEQEKHVMLIDIHDVKAWPFKVEIDELISDHFEVVDDPVLLISPEAGSKAAHTRDRAYNTLKPILESYSSLFDKKQRNALIKSLIQTSGEPRLYVTRQLRRYWQRGMVPDALASNYLKCGNPGAARRDGARKVGSKRTVSSGVGCYINEEIAACFKLAIDSFYLTREDIDLEKARIKAIGYIKSKNPTIAKSDLPTARQFRWYFSQNYQKSDVLKRKISNIEYEKDVAPLKSTSSTNNFGPGGRYEIDATIADIYLISQHDPNRIIGRPVIYKVKDVFSRMTVGLYIGLENPSWATASIALSNAFCDKVEYCRQFDIDITTKDWPSVGLPATLTADRGELLGKHGDIIVNRFGITLSNTRAYRGSDKGVVERSFKTLHADILPYVDGKVEPFNGKKKAGKRNELSANLTLFDFTRMVILSELDRNNISPLKEYDFAADMPSDLPPIPIHLWNWGISHRTGFQKEVDQKLIRVNLLPHAKASVSIHGISFKGLLYTCSEAVSLGWFHRTKSSDRPSKVEIAYHPLDTNTLYIRPNDQFESFWICSLQPKSRRYADMSFVEAASIQNESRKVIATAKQESAYQAPDLQAELQKMVEKAQVRKEGADLSNKTERLRGIEENRNQEKALERQKIRDAQRPKSEQKGKAKVVPIKAEIKSEGQFDYPDLDDF